MTAEKLYNLLNKWKNTSYLSEYTLIYDEVVYSQALKAFEYDYKRWYPNDERINEDKLLLTPQLHGILAYRLASLWYTREDNTSDVKQSDIISNIGRINSMTEIYYSSKIGLGLKINHGIGTVIGARCEIGDNCIIHQNVTLGDKKSGRPSIGNNCIIYAGAIVIGDIKIGDNCIIGANSVVMNDFPSNSIIAGIPARKVK